MVLVLGMEFCVRKAFQNMLKLSKFENKKNRNMMIPNTSPPLGG
jgi:hypothetical protein